MREEISLSACCENDCHVDAPRARQRTTLKLVLGINAAMFFVPVATAMHARSIALLPYSLDNLGDPLTYGLSLYPLSRGGSV